MRSHVGRICIAYLYRFSLVLAQLRSHKDGSTFRGQLDGPHRVHLVKNGALTSLVTAAARFPQDAPLCRAAAAGIMYLAGPGREASEPVSGFI